MSARTLTAPALRPALGPRPPTPAALASLARFGAAARVATVTFPIHATLDLMDGRWTAARSRLGEAHRSRPGLRRFDDRLGTIERLEGHPERALAEFEAERRAPEPTAIVDLRLGQALRALGRLDEAQAAFRRAEGVEATRAEARDSLAALERR